jgi:hypothetical protein
LCVKVSTPEKEVSKEDVEKHLRSVIGDDGVMGEFTDEVLKGLVDFEMVRKNYKIKGGGDKDNKKGVAGVPGVGMDGLEVEVLGKMVGRVVC